MVCEITPDVKELYRKRIQQEDIQKATKYKYLHELELLQEYLHGEQLTQEKLDAYPNWLMERKNYKKNSVNSAVASAKKFILVMGWSGFQAKSCAMNNYERKQLKKYVSQEDYVTIVKGAMLHEKEWLAMLLQTLCHMGIRYSEFDALTVEAVKKGYVKVTRMGSEIDIPMPKPLAKLLLQYADGAGIKEGMLLRTAKGNLPDRSYVWRQLKLLCKKLELEENECTLVQFKMPEVEDYYPYIKAGCKGDAYKNSSCF